MERIEYTYLPMLRKVLEKLLSWLVICSDPDYHHQIIITHSTEIYMRFMLDEMLVGCIIQKRCSNPITIPTYYIISPMSFFNCEKNPLVLNSRDSKMKSFYYLCTSLSTRHTHLILLNFVGLTREIELSILSVGAATFWNLPPWLPIGPNNYFLAFIISGYWY